MVKLKVRDSSYCLTEYYHVRITRKSDKKTDIVEFDLNKSQLLKSIVEPIEREEDFFCGGALIQVYDIDRIIIKVTSDHSIKVIGELRISRISALLRNPRAKAEPTIAEEQDYVFQQGIEVTRNFITKLPQGKAKLFPNQKVYDPKKVFIVHGHDNVSKLELARLLEKLDLEPIILHEQPNKGRTLIEKLEHNASNVGYAFIILTPDDFGGETSDKLQPRARQNVILELGYFMGRLGRDRICCLYKGAVELPSDMFGVVYLHYDNNMKECFSEIATELTNSGYRLRLNSA